MYRLVIFSCLLLATFARRKSNTAGKIVGGVDTDISKVPYQVSVQYGGFHVCGGSIIGTKFILTAAHCVDKKDEDYFSVRAGSNYYLLGGQEVDVVEVISHPNYNSETTNYDVAVLELESPLTTNEKVQIRRRRKKPSVSDFNYDAAILVLKKPLELNDLNVKTVGLAETEPTEGEMVLISGWGATQEDSGATIILQSTEVPVVSREKCRRRFSRINPITDLMFCAGYMKGGKDSCQGDSGGPAVVNGKLAGVVSWGVGCGLKGTPGVYTNVAKIKDWIRQQTLE